jgi:hypothetical protein
MSTAATLFLLLIAPHSPPAHAQAQDVSFSAKPAKDSEAPPESKVYGKRLDGQTITVTGFVQDEPRFHTGYNGNYQSWTFTMNASAERRHGDEFLSVTFHTVKWGKTVGEFKLKKGEEVTLKGRFSEFKGARKGTGIVGAFYVNDFSIDEVKDMH